MTAQAPSPAALSDLRVLDLTRVRAGPTCVRQLGDWGADVIKVEMRQPGGGGGGDFADRHDPDFQNLQRNRRSIAIDLKTEAGQEVFARLVAGADVLVENFRPDVKHRLGIDYETLAKANPRLIYASISGFGEDGPYAKRPGVDQIAQGMSGLMSVTGEPGRGPMRVGTALADLSSGLFAALGILTALHERSRSGKGQWVTTSLLQAQVFMLDFQAARYLMKGEVAEQAGNNHPTGVPTGVFRAADCHLNIAPTPPMWPRFCKALEREDLIEHPDYASPALRLTNLAAMNAEIEAITVKQPGAHWIEVMNAAGIPCGPIYAIDQMFADPQIRHLKVYDEVQSTALGPIKVLAQPVRLSRTPSKVDRAAPEYSEHVDEILEGLGYGTEEIARLKEEGAV